MTNCTAVVSVQRNLAVHVLSTNGNACERGALLREKIRTMLIDIYVTHSTMPT